ncbi:MAG: phosphotransferase [Anaerolineae bacterium]|jgi:Ser/Thr protein kinase RdoA (MazF antagonist)|nr:phosphotransferase [Anaerolineae bacterium]
MKPVPAIVRKELAEQCGLDNAILRQLAGGQASSDGVIYKHGTDPVLMKVMALPANDELALLRLVERFQFARYMGNNGVRLVFPQAIEDGSLYVSYQHEEDLYVAYLMDYIPGANIRAENWRARFYTDWGQLIGKMHRLTKEYPIWQHATVQTSAGEKQIFGWESEWVSFYDWCQDTDVRKAFLQVKAYFESLPQERDCYGFIHNDPHAENLLYDGKHLVLIDFDVANCHWFITDIAITLQNTLFQAGGLYQYVQDRRKVMTHYNAFREGYETENQLDEFWWQQIDHFIQYRRCMAFTFLYDWLGKDAHARNMWKSMIKLNPNVIHVPRKNV